MVLNSCVAGSKLFEGSAELIVFYDQAGYLVGFCNILPTDIRRRKPNSPHPVFMALFIILAVKRFKPAVARVIFVCGPGRLQAIPQC